VSTPNVPAAKRAGLLVDLDRLGREGDGWLTPEDRYALKTYGVCAQVQPGVFMVRIRVPGGRLAPAQADGLARLAEEHGGSWIHLTTRQNVELHTVDAHVVPDVLAAVDALELTNRSACGHTLRNVMSCPDAGAGLDEPFDCLPDAQAVSAAIVARSAELNCTLPSRVNLAFGGCSVCSEHARLNDGGFESVVVGGDAGYRLWAGGSLGTAPALAVPLVSFIPRRHAVAAAEALIETFIDHGDFENPKKGRLKFAIEAIGGDAFRDSFLEHYDAACVRTTYSPVRVDVPGPADVAAVLEHVPPCGWSQAVRPQRTPGQVMVTVNVPMGDLRADEFRRLGDLATYGDGFVTITRNQNLQFRDVAVEDVAALRRAVEDVGLALSGADAACDVRACTGSAVCSLGITAAPTAGAGLLQSDALGRNSQLRVHISGCPNSCAQHQAADIGFAGGKVRIEGTTRLGYTVYAGATVDGGRLAEPIGRVAQEHVGDAVDGIVGTWEVLRRPGERLGDTLRRIGPDAFAAHVGSIARGDAADEVTDAAAGDAIDLTSQSVARPPQAALT
jgi:sulfite reductase beta subunit-like hemoprotein